MSLFLLSTLSLTLAAYLVSFCVTEEMEQLGAKLMVILCLFLSILFSPLLLKIILLSFLLSRRLAIG
jgi:hypothetical protein